MNEMLERVARALCRKSINRPDYNPVDIDRNVDEKWPLFVDHARVAIASMRIPTEAMVAAGRIELGKDDDGGVVYLHGGEAEEVWQAMNDEALK